MLKMSSKTFQLAFFCLCSFAAAAMAERDVLLGGVSEPQKGHSQDSIVAAGKAVEHINAKPELLRSLGTDPGPVSLSKVLEVKTQVVAGINYYLTLELEHQGKPFQATMVVWSRPWLAHANTQEEPYQVSKLERKELAQ
ncbi:hypothetical protein DUNSADRAFT_1128 [Dunaliella salina]|uniref:Cystatin domain-containing protein n=1 Tax=Dunaliella salina TaxID=3046 RepID=A0ABQ7FY12_DUNSA|nr:hypothetical protein DUNSADRAFT_1128 [Dunaliella salina]|eukprot:KAF5827217.1 hypothetical protein DUNSADRAFT_1128 [Dunaliella salina]